MMIKYLLLICFSFSLVMVDRPSFAESFGIVATVNEDAISQKDLEDRIKLVLVSSGLRDTKENRNKVRKKTADLLIDEKLQLQEAEKQKLQITDEEVNNGYQTMATQNKMKPEEFDKVLGVQGIAKQTLLDQIRAQIAWRKVIAKVLRPRIDVTENDINAKKERIKSTIGRTEYRTAEIFLPVVLSSEEEKTKQLANQLIDKMKSGEVSFNQIALQFSKSASAPNGGKIGWIQEGELPKELDLVLKSLNEGQISPPVKTISGFYILTVLERRAVSGETMPSDQDVLNSIGLERLDRLQRRYLSDIRSAAFIDQRG